jgi:hypothetical protein
VYTNHALLALNISVLEDGDSKGLTQLIVRTDFVSYNLVTVKVAVLGWFIRVVDRSSQKFVKQRIEETGYFSSIESHKTATMREV